MAAEVYSTFLNMSSDAEAHLWKKMLSDELDHVEHLKKLLDSNISADLILPDVNIAAMRSSCDRIAAHGNNLFLLRLEGALRLECAELDYGLEGVVARKMEKSALMPSYPGDVSTHIMYLLDEAKRYSVSPNIGRQIGRLTDLLETCMRSTRILPAEDGDASRI